MVSCETRGARALTRELDAVLRVAPYDDASMALYL